MTAKRATAAHSSAIAATLNPRVGSRGLLLVGNRRCSWCREFGHNRRNFPLKPPPDAELLRKNAAARAAIARMSPEEKRRFQDANRCRVYGLKPEDVEAIRADQHGTCGLCGADLRRDGRGWKGEHIDHDHESGRIRGLLCGVCNTAVGQLESFVRRGLVDKMLSWIDRDALALLLKRGAA